MPNLKKMTPRQNAQFYYMMDVMRRFEWDMHNRIEQSGRIPGAWHDIAKEPAVLTKRQVNIGLEEDVLKFFKSLGKGYGAKINLILKSYMHARLAGILEGAETLNHFKKWELEFDEPKPKFGFFARELKQEWEDPPREETRQGEKERFSEILRLDQAQKDGKG